MLLYCCDTYNTMDGAVRALAMEVGARLASNNLINSSTDDQLTHWNISFTATETQSFKYSSNV